MNCPPERPLARVLRPLALLLFAWAAVGSGAAQAADVLYARSGGALFDGRFGPLAQFQAALGRALVDCRGPASALEPDGKFGAGTVNGIKALTACPVAQALPAADPARDGSVSAALWRLLLPDTALPSLDARAQTLVLTYEATDYTRAEWNFCQNKPRFEPTVPGSVCHSNDPRSYLTWGPRGATAGHGREVQAVLWLMAQRDGAALERAFGAELPQVERLLSLSPAAVEKMLCSVWMDPARRSGWQKSFAALGAAPSTRAAYDAYYRTLRSDGAKIQTFFRLYELAGLTATEVDYGFFVDRATHSTPPRNSELAALATQIRTAVADQGQPNAQARLLLARTVRPGNPALRADRMGRDMAFLLDALGDGDVLSTEERTQWAARGRFKASDVGLSDDRQVAAFTPSVLDLTGLPAASSDHLTPQEEQGCPAAVLHPVP
jgi:hypothetical protein